MRSEEINGIRRDDGRTGAQRGGENDPRFRYLSIRQELELELELDVKRADLRQGSCFVITPL